MAHFYGTLSGSGQARSTRGGTKFSGLRALARSHNGEILTTLWHDRRTGTDMARVERRDGHGNTREILFEGPLTPPRPDVMSTV